MNKCRHEADYGNYLNRNSFLSEFSSELDKKLARENLGITNLIEILNNKIDSKVIENRSIAWDETPTEGHTEYVLSSDALYRTLLNYVLKSDILLLWTRLININRETKNSLEEEIARLKLLVDTFLQTSGGIALDNKFGTSDYVGIGQKTLTDALNQIWDKLDEITGEQTRGIILTVTPDYFIGDSGCDVLINITGKGAIEFFEKLYLYANDELIAEVENVNSFSKEIHIDELTEIKCIGTMLGVNYTDTKTVEYYNNFFLLPGQFETEEEVVEYALLHTEYSRPTVNKLRGCYDIICLLNDHIYVILPESLNDDFLRADLNGIEIPFEFKTVTVNDTRYVVYTSNSVYNPGLYNIDING